MPDIIVSSGHDYNASVADSTIWDGGLSVDYVGIDVEAGHVDVYLNNGGYHNTVTVGSTGSYGRQYLEDQTDAVVTVNSGVTGNELTLYDGAYNTVKDSGGSSYGYDSVYLRYEYDDTAQLYGSNGKLTLYESTAGVATGAGGHDIYLNDGSGVSPACTARLLPRGRDFR